MTKVYPKLMILVSLLLWGSGAWALDEVGGVYQIGTAEDLFAFAEMVNGGENAADAVLTADITYENGTMIGTDAVYYAGTFDGQWHKISYTIDAPEKGGGLFRSLSGTVQNLVVDGTLTCASNLVGTIAGWLYGGTIRNCVSSVDIQSSFTGDAAYAGIASRASAAGCLIENCVYTGGIYSAAAANCAGILGWIADGFDCPINNCLYTGVITPAIDSGSNVSYTITRRESLGPCTNCYYVNKNVNVNNGTTQVTPEEVMSGAVCYMLNLNQSEITWTQNIGEDNFPYPNTLHKQVYAAGDLSCNGWVKEGGKLTFSNTKTQEIPPHHFADGFCTECGTADTGMSQEIDGVLQIGTAEQLNWFAQRVNAGENTLNAALTSDITLPADFPVIATSSNRYSGTFDGQFHTLTIDLTATASNYGLFRALAGTIKNLHLAGKFNAAYNRVGPLVGEIFGGTLENINCSVEIAATYVGDAAIGGLIGRASGKGNTIRNCMFSGKIEGMSAYNCGAFLGFLSGDGVPTAFESCAHIGTIAVDEAQGNARVLARWSDGTTPSTFKDCYYVNPYGNDNEGVNQVTIEDVASGALCYLLNGNQSEIKWTQTIGEDAIPYPNLQHKQVYAAGNLICTGWVKEGDDISFSNTKSSEIPPHHYVDGVCTECGITEAGMCEEIDGFFQIGTPEQMAWFARKVNAGENTINGALTADITLSADFPVIATSSNKYSGTFDGQFHTITIDLTATEANYGLFRALAGTIKNLHIDGSFNAAFNRVGPLVGEIFGGTLENIWSSVEVAATFAGDGAISGMVGRGSAAGSILRNCIFSGTIEGMTAYNCAALVGFTANDLTTPTTTLENCAFTGTITVDESQGNGFVLARNDGVLSLTNCYYVNPYGSVNSNTKQVTAEQATNGTLAALLNAPQATTVWFQELGEDECPVPFSTHPQIYTVCGVSGNAHNDAAYTDFSKAVYESQADYCENVFAQKSLVEEYSQAYPILNDAKNIDELLAAYAQIEEQRNALLANEAAYAAYVKKVEETKQYLEEHDDFSGSKRDELTDYLNEFEEPGDLFTFGSATYILEEREMTTEEIENETKKIDLWLNEAITEVPQAGTDVTLLLTNPTFADGSNGWTGAAGFETSTSETSPLIGVQCYNATMDMYQTLTGLQNGIYELRVNGAFRPYPYEDYYNTNYAAMLYLNDVHNYFQADIEDMVSVADAVDGYNCHITGDVPDYFVQDIEGNVIGYTMHGMIGVANAIQADRYPNSVICEVTDGTLMVGISQPGTGQQPEWLGFGNLKLIYHGAMEEATVGLDNTLASMAARANTLVNTYVPSSAEDYATYPNFSQALKDELTATMAAVEGASDNAAKYALIQKFSDLFQQVYDCKKAYIGLMAQSVMLQDLAGALGAILTDEELDELNNAMEYVQTAYMDGLASIEEAQKDYTNGFSFIPKKVDGVYQIGNAQQMIMFANIVNGGEFSANAVLTADVDMTGTECPSIGTASSYYGGTFDGQYHKLTIAHTATEDGGSFFRSLSGTVRNLRIDGTLTTNFKKCGGIVGELFAGTVENCWCSVQIIGTLADDCAYGGIVSRASAKYGNIRNCVFDGQIISEGGYNMAGILGWVGDDCSATITNCLYAGEISAVAESSSNPSYTICRRESLAPITNCFYVNEWVNHNNGTTQVTAEQLASGEITFLLNGNQGNIQWTQTIGTDPAPVPFLTQSTVYAQGNLTCSGLATVDGSPLAYGNEDTANREEHQFKDGFCSVCGAPQPDVCELVDGFYQIGDITQLLWFANKVNAGENNINAQITADIDFSGWEGTFPMIGNSTNYFAGIFDGQYHTITVKLTSTSDNCGLFQYASGTIKNLRVDGTIVSTHKFTSGVCAQSYAATFENIISSVTINSAMSGDSGIGGIVSRASEAGTVINNCLVNFTINGTSASNVGGIIGWTATAASISNCLSIPTFNCSSTDSYTIARNPGNAACTNVYYNTTFGGVNDGSTLITEEQLANGEVLALLNEGQEVAQWTQKEGQANPTPFPAGTGIEETVADSAKTINNNAIYNLMGQKVQKAQKGIYIIGGKKVLVK